MSENPWVSIWTQPRSTIRKIVAINPNKSLWLLAAIYGFSSLLNLFQSMGMGAGAGIFLILGLGIVLSPFWGYAVFSIWSGIVCFTGKWLKGKGDFKKVRAAYSWSCVPLIFNVIFWFILIGIFGQQLFLAIPEERFTDKLVVLLFAILIAKVVLAIWSLVIYLNALAEVQQFSILRAIGNVIIAAIIISILFTLIWMGVAHLMGTALPLGQGEAVQGIFHQTNIVDAFRGVL